MKEKLYKSYMACAFAFARQSYAKRLKVGCIAVTPQDLIVYSYNGTACGDNNLCETEDGKATLDTVLHSEANVVAKAAREGISLSGATVFVTHMPCLACGKLLAQAGISRVVYAHKYRLEDGVEYLAQRGVEVEQYSSQEVEGCYK